MFPSPSRLPILALCISLCGCPNGGTNGPSGPAKSSSLLQPYQGQWKFDLEKTLDEMGAHAEYAEEKAVIDDWLRSGKELGALHPDLSIQGTIGQCSGLLGGKYDFFGLHQHSGFVCGKAWHHEDIHDPGDMSKHFVQFELREGALVMRDWTLDGNPDMSDPDLFQMPVEDGSPETCAFDHQGQTDWLPAIYVFVRK